MSYTIGPLYPKFVVFCMPNVGLPKYLIGGLKAILPHEGHF